ncbi:MAG: hypothetical protein ABW252_23585 [Polyangiales bacterium]
MKRVHGWLLALGLAAPSVVAAQDAEAPLTEADLAQLTGAASTSDGAASGASKPMTSADLEALGIGASAPSVDKRLQFSGFADFSFTTLLMNKDNVWRSFNVGPAHPSFYVGSINLYLSKYLTEKLFTLGEIRFSYLPNGSSSFGVAERTSTLAYDYVDYGRPMRWGGIEIERFYVDYIAHPRLTIRMGQWLTPYGIWNVDHGSPTIVPPSRPWVIAVGWFPERQTGIELLGSYDVSSYGTLGYHLTVSNGTGPVSEYADLDDNKALGGRLYWDYRRLGQLRIGASAYYGRETTAKTGVVADPKKVYKSVERVAIQFDSLAFAGDLRFLYRGWHLQTEWMVHQRAYTEEGRTRAGTLLSSASVPADLVSWGGYALIGYRFAWGGIMPFFRFERDKTDVVSLPIDLVSLSGGFNVRPVDVFVFKAAYEHIIPLSDIYAKQPMRSLQLQVAWAF